jgi:uncharacterized membrane protein YsdA (DUF1294 family)
MDISVIVLIVLGAITLIMSIYTFALYAKDKKIAPTAVDGKGRIKEKTLISMAFFMGGIGAVVGMQRLRHKTNKPKFKILVPLGLILNIVIIVGAFLLARTFIDG